jgi:hypothetical protein
MALSFLVNQVPATGSSAVFLLKEHLKSVGWTVPRSSDGTTYNSSGDQITQAGAGANGMANIRAWFVIKQPVIAVTVQGEPGARELCFQRSATAGATGDDDWRFKYARSTTFTLGAPAATVTPSASDEVVLLGAGTDAAPTFTTVFEANGTYRMHGFAHNTAPYAFAFFAPKASGATGNPTAIMMDVMVEGSYPGLPGGDADPYIFYTAVGNDVWNVGGSSTNDMSSETAAQGPRGWIRAGLTGAGFVNISICAMQGSGSVLVLPGFVGSNPFNGKDILFPGLWVRRAGAGAPSGWKGVSTFCKTVGTRRGTGAVLSELSSRDHFVMREIALPWDGVTTPLI